VPALSLPPRAMLPLPRCLAQARPALPALRCAARRCLSSAPPPAPPQAGFMARAAAAGAQALLGAFTSTGSRYDRTIEGLTVLSVEPARVVCELRVREAHSNSYGTLHGGCTATLVDIVGTMAALAVDPLRPGVSVDMNISYMAAAKVGERVVLVGRCLRMGGRLAFTTVELYLDSEGGKMVARGSHTKAL
jgi:acyl-coenzyme A thioesterase 13